MKGLNKFKVKKILLAVVLLGAGVSAANAAQVPPIYGRLSLGYAIPGGVNYDGNNQRVDVKQDGNVLTALALGIQPGAESNKKFKQRYEFEVAYRTFDAKSVNDVKRAGNEANRGSTFAGVTTMVNAYLDFASVPYVQPYVGAGIGAAFIDQDTRFSDTATSTAISTITGKDTVFAAQLMAGATKQINDKISLQADVKYLTALEFDGQRTTGTTKTSVSGNFGETSINFGVRYKF